MWHFRKPPIREFGATRPTNFRSKPEAERARQAVAYHIKQRYPNEPIILLSAYSEMPEAVLWLVDEYVMRSEPAERLAHVIERVARSSSKKEPNSAKGPKYPSAAA
jgi:hypothetical protein